MEISKKLENGTLTIALEGRLDTNTAPLLEAEMNLDGAKDVEFDLERLEYVSSAGLRVFLSAMKAVSGAGGGVTILHPNASVASVLEITGLDSVFRIVR